MLPVGPAHGTTRPDRSRPGVKGEYACLESRAVPELPDLAILADALDAGLAGRPMTGMTTPQSLVVRGTPAELAAFNGQVLNEVSRRGKFLIFAFDRDRIIVNAMLTGRLGFAAPGSKAWPNTAAILEFGPRQAERADRRAANAVAKWVAGRRLAAAARCFQSRCAIATRRGWARST